MAKAKGTRAQREDDGLQRLLNLQRLGQALYEREAERLARKYGVDDPRAQRIIRTASGAGVMLAAMEITADNKPQTVKAEENETVVYGRVAHDNLKAAARVEVMLEDTNGRVMRAAGSATTDASGRFVLRIPPAVAEKLAGKEYLITARDSNGEVVFRYDKSVKLDLNRAINVEINLGARKPINRPTTQPGKPNEPDTPPSPPEPTETVVFNVTGQVVNSDGKPVTSVLVKIYDKDVKFDDLVGATLTNREGRFSVSFRRQDFSEKEANADLFFVVVDAEEKVLLSTAANVLIDADHNITITLKVV